MNKKEIGQLVKERREFLHLKQEDVSEMSGVSSKTIYLIESGEGNPAIQTLGTLLDVLGMEMKVFVKRMNA